MNRTILRGPLPKAINPSEAGVVAAAGVTVSSDSGLNEFRRTVLDFSNLAITLTDDAGVGQYGSKKLCTLPACGSIILASFLDGTLTLLAPFIATASVELGVGFTAPANGDALAGTEKTLISRATAVSVALVNTYAAGGVLSAAALTDGRAAAKDIYLNAIVADNALHATTANNLLNGSLVLLWSPLTDVA